MLAIVWIALSVSACSSSRQTTSSSEQLKVESLELRDSSRVESVDVMDSLIVVTTIIIDRNEVGDTVRLTQVTDRTRARTRDNIARQSTKTVVKTDTVYVERRDSVATYQVTDYPSTDSGTTALYKALKWMVALVVAVIILVLVIRFSFR